MFIDLGRCGAEGNFHNRGAVGHFALESENFGWIPFSSAEKIKWHNGRLVLPAIVGDVEVESKTEIMDFGYGDSVVLSYDIATQCVAMKKEGCTNDDDDGTWCLSPMMRRTRSGL